jgi:hypothetical protein
VTIKTGNIGISSLEISPMTYTGTRAGAVRKNIIAMIIPLDPFSCMRVGIMTVPAGYTAPTSEIICSMASLTRVFTIAD